MQNCKFAVTETTTTADLYLMPKLDPPHTFFYISCFAQY